MNDEQRFALTPAGEFFLQHLTEFRAGQRVQVLGWNVWVTLRERRTLRGARWWVAQWDEGGELHVPEAFITEIAS